MDLSVFSDLLEGLYTDLLSIQRHVEVSNEDGTTGIQITTVATDIDCRISFQYGGRDMARSFEVDRNPIDLSAKVFCDQDVDVRKGDILRVERRGSDQRAFAVYKGIANMPFHYETHQEIEIIQMGDA